MLMRQGLEMGLLIAPNQELHSSLIIAAGLELDGCQVPHG
jgi:hypothetical protein